MLELLLMHYPELACVRQPICEAVALLTAAYRSGKKLLLCGNGGSAADCEHIAGELMKGFLKRRPIAEGILPPGLDTQLQGALPAIPLTGQIALSTAYANDMDGEYTFAQQAYGLTQPGDVLLALSTSGLAQNVCQAVRVANALGATTIALTGQAQSPLSDLCHLAIQVPARETYRVQELHLPVYHTICAMVEEAFFAV